MFISLRRNPDLFPGDMRMKLNPYSTWKLLLFLFQVVSKTLKIHIVPACTRNWSFLSHFSVYSILVSPQRIKTCLQQSSIIWSIPFEQSPIEHRCYLLSNRRSNTSATSSCPLKAIWVYISPEPRIHEQATHMCGSQLNSDWEFRERLSIVGDSGSDGVHSIAWNGGFLTVLCAIVVVCYLLDLDLFQKVFLTLGRQKT